MNNSPSEFQPWEGNYGVVLLTNDYIMCNGLIKRKASVDVNTSVIMQIESVLFNFNYQSKIKAITQKYCVIIIVNKLLALQYYSSNLIYINLTNINIF